MVKRLIEQLSALLTDNPQQSDPKLSAETAAVALLIEVCQLDAEEHPGEEAALKRWIVETLGWSDSDAEQLLIESRELHETENALYPMTRQINDHWSEAQKFELVMAAWEIALSDGELHRLEEHGIRKIADLVYLPHSEFIRAKLLAQEAQASD